MVLRAFVDLYCGVLKLNKKGWSRICQFRWFWETQIQVQGYPGFQNLRTQYLKEKGTTGGSKLDIPGTFFPQGICRFFNFAGSEAKKPSRNLQLKAKNEEKSLTDHSVKKTKIGVQSPPRIRGLDKHFQIFNQDPQKEIL